MLVLLGSLYLISVQGGNDYSRVVLFLMGGLYVVITYITRLLWKHYLKHKMKNEGNKSLIIVTSSSIAEVVIRNVKEHNYKMYKINGVIIIDKSMIGEDVEGVTVVSDSKNAADYLCQGWVDEVFIILNKSTSCMKEFIERCSEMGLTVHLNLAKVSDSA